MSASFSRARRKRLEAATERAERITEADARFFARFPHRSHRVRLSSQSELDANAVIAGVPKIETEPGYRWFTAVKQLAPGVRARLFMQNASDADPEMDETNAEAVYEYLAGTGGSKAREIEAQLRAAIAKRGR